MLEFRNCRIHMIPWLRVRYKKIHLGTKPTRVIQAASRDSDHFRRPAIGFAARNGRAAFGAKATPVLAAGGTRCEMVAQLPLRQAKCGRRREQTWDKSAAAHSLAVATVTLEHHG